MKASELVQLINAEIIRSGDLEVAVVISKETEGSYDLRVDDVRDVRINLSKTHIGILNSKAPSFLAHNRKQT